jgi:endonuclease/exonuclease/phosphatase family metal-dependent hydrolase
MSMAGDHDMKHRSRDQPSVFRRVLLLLLISFGALPSTLLAQEDGSLQVMTFNVRFASPNPPNAWPDRRPLVREVIERSAPDVIGTQEGLYRQLMEMEEDLNGYAWIGLGREGGSRGEFMAVFYRTERLVPLAFDHYWLSDTPELIASRTWGNYYHRMVTWVRFHDRETDREFYLVNTHFDHEVQLARENSARLIVERLEAFDPALPVLLIGDFNAAAGDNPVYDILVDQAGFVDTWRAAGHAEPPFGTYHAFEGVEGATGRARIDWILVRGPVRTLAAEIDTFGREGQYPSDHFPVVARVRFEPDP